MSARGDEGLYPRWGRAVVGAGHEGLATAEIGFPGEIRFGMGPDEARDLAALEDAPTPEGMDDWQQPEAMVRATPMSLFPTVTFESDPGRVVVAQGGRRVYRRDVLGRLLR
jgi:hypothetical protein